MVLLNYEKNRFGVFLCLVCIISALSLSRGLCQQLLGHERRVVVTDLPFSILKDVNKRVSGPNHTAVGSLSEFVDTDILAPILTNTHIRLNNLSVGLDGQEFVKIVLDARVGRSRNITYSGQKDGALGVSSRDGIRVTRQQSVVPQLEQTPNFRFGNDLTLGFGHFRRVVVLDFPDSVLLGVQEGIAGTDALPVLKGKLVNSNVHGVVGLGLDCFEGDEQRICG